MEQLNKKGAYGLGQEKNNQVAGNSQKSKIHSDEYLELKNMFFQQQKHIVDVIDFLMPPEFSLSYLAQRTGWSRAGLKAKIQRSYSFGKDYYKKDGLIYMTREVALAMIVVCPSKVKGVKCAS